jgi:hypothetical protein
VNCLPRRSLPKRRRVVFRLNPAAYPPLFLDNID